MSTLYISSPITKSQTTATNLQNSGNQGNHPGVSAVENRHKPTIVTIRQSDGKFQLLCDGQPFFIRGAGGRHHMKELAEAGANSVRTWHTGDIKTVLDRAESFNLKVSVGIWLPHEKRGFNYSDPKQIEHLKERTRKTITAYKDHPAILIWSIGNEMEEDGSKAVIWKTINDLAKITKETDPNHPTMTVIAGTGKNKINQLKTYCPDIDIVGINAYGDLKRIPPALKKQGLDRPYIITEFGPYGWWQVKKTSWGAELEPTSTQKAKTYRESYEAAVSSQTEKCLGAYAFLWGNKQEHTYTWFSMILPTGERTASVDEMTNIWTGKYPSPRCPVIENIEIIPREKHKPSTDKGENIYPPGTILHCRVNADSPSGENLTANWELHSESGDKKTSGYAEERPPAHPQAIIESKDLDLTLKLPEKPGAYRLFVVVKGNDNNAGTANIPILVR